MLPTTMKDAPNNNKNATQTELKPKSLASKRSMAHLAEKSPYSTASKIASPNLEGNHDFVSQQNQELLQA